LQDGGKTALDEASSATGEAPILFGTEVLGHRGFSYCTFQTVLLWFARLDAPIQQRHLKKWKLLAAFKEALERLSPALPNHSSWSDPKRRLAAADYYALFLFGLFNPVVQTMRGLCAASRLPRVQAQVCGRPVSLGSFSAAQHVADLSLLEKIFAQLGQQLCQRPDAWAGPGQAPWLIRDSTLWEVLPRMGWALWRQQGRAQSAVRLHVSLHVLEDAPVRAQVTAGSFCERKAWRQDWRPGDAYIGDRYFAEDYRLLEELDQRGCPYVLRLRQSAAFAALEELPLNAEAIAQNVRRDAWVQLGNPKLAVRPRVRLVWVQGPREELILVTNKTPAELPAGLVSQLYRQRWQVELFFRWIKCVLGCRHWLAESPEGVAAQIYLALIGALLLQLYSGQRPTRRQMEMLQFYLMGVASLEDLEKSIQKEAARKKLN